MTDFKSDLSPWDKVTIDGDNSLVGIVTSFQFRPTSDGGLNPTVGVSYVHNGTPQEAWIERIRLQKK